MDALSIAIELLQTHLQLGPRAQGLTPQTKLMGAFPEINSLSVVGIVAGIEDTLGCEIPDTEISEEVFESVGTLAAFIDTKMS